MANKEPVKLERNEHYVRTDLGQMKTFRKRSDEKYRRNYNRFYNNMPRSDDIYQNYSNVLAYYTQYDEMTGVIPVINLIRSCIDTAVSKISQNKLRKFFNPVLGTWRTMKVCRSAQVFMDLYYDMQKVSKKAEDALYDALIFDMGVLWIDDETATVQNVAPWEFVWDAAELANNKLTRCALVRQQYPMTLLLDVIPPESSAMYKVENTPNATCMYEIYYDLLNKKVWKFIDGQTVSTRDVEFERPPFVWMYYKTPVKGPWSDSMADILRTPQKFYDDILYKISAAVEVSPANTIFIPKGSGLERSLIASSKIGDVFEYNAGAAGGITNPVQISTPPAIDQQYIQILNLIEEKCYNIIGISQMSAQSKKPGGIQSGVALDTLQDVESERHNSLQMAYTRLQSDLAEILIDVLPENADVLPKGAFRSGIKWKDIKKERNMFRIQFSDASTLSKDPKTKMEQIEKLIGMKVIDPSQAATLLEFPDLETAYGINTASYDDNEKIIERAIENGPEATMDPVTGAIVQKYNFYEITNTQQLFAQACTTLLRLDANDEDPRTLLNLVNLIKQIKQQIDAINATLAPAPAPTPVQPPVVQGPTNPLPMVAPTPVQ